MTDAGRVEGRDGDSIGFRWRNVDRFELSASEGCVPCITARISLSPKQLAGFVGDLARMVRGPSWRRMGDEETEEERMRARLRQARIERGISNPRVDLHCSEPGCQAVFFDARLGSWSVVQGADVAGIVDLPEGWVTTMTTGALGVDWPFYGLRCPACAERARRASAPGE